MAVLNIFLIITRHRTTRCRQDPRGSSAQSNRKGVPLSSREPKLPHKNTEQSEPVFNNHSPCWNDTKFLLVPLNDVSRAVTEHPDNVPNRATWNGEVGLRIKFPAGKFLITLGSSPDSDIYLPSEPHMDESQPLPSDSPYFFTNPSFEKEISTIYDVYVSNIRASAEKGRQDRTIETWQACFYLNQKSGMVLLGDLSGDNSTRPFCLGAGISLRYCNRRTILVDPRINPCVAFGRRQVYRFKLVWSARSLIQALFPAVEQLITPTAAGRYLRGILLDKDLTAPSSAGWISLLDIWSPLRSSRQLQGSTSDPISS